MSTLPVTVTRMTFDDEFNTFSNSSNGSTGTWMTSLPYGGEAARTLSGNNELEYYSDSSVGVNPFALNNGVLDINATPAAAGSNPYGLTYNSGVITTDKSFSQTYGYFEVNAVLPSGQGLWPAFWLLPATNAYTSELDVFESIDSQSTTIYSTVHGSTNGTWGADSQALASPNTSTGFHTFGVDWEPTTTTFYIDGITTGSAPTPTSMNDPMFILLNLAVGGQGSWPGAPDHSTVFPATMQINDVRVYATANTTYVGGSAAIAAGSTAPSPPVSTPPVVTPPTVSTPVTIGSGADVLALSVSEDAWQGDAQFTVSVDGTQIGGTQTAKASNAAGATQIFNVQGTFASSQHTVTVNFLNDAYGNSTTTDRNLYVTGATINGGSVANGTLSLMTSGGQSFAFTGSQPVVPTIGTGADVLALTLSEDAWQGDAQFLVSVDGVQIGGTQTATASHAAGATQTLNVLGTYAAGQHNVTLDFLNDAYGGSSTTDRNLYVTAATVNGTAVPNAATALMSSGNESFAFTGTSTTTTGNSDWLDLHVSGDSWQGGAQFNVTIDGKQIGGTQTVTASHAAGATQDISLSGNWGLGAHTVGISFINDAYGGTAATDRNLYVNQVSYDGQVAASSNVALMSNGTTNITTPTAAPLTLVLSEDAYQGDANFTVSVDGKQVGQTNTVTAIEGLKQLQAFNIPGNLAVGSHDVSISFLNDQYGGTSTTDRNLYVKALEVNGTTVPGASASMMSTSTDHFSITIPHS